MSNVLDTIVIFQRTFPMDTRDKKKLFKNFVRLVTETPVDPVVRHLVGNAFSTTNKQKTFYSKTWRRIKFDNC
jgi:hypothetical protein